MKYDEALEFLFKFRVKKDHITRTEQQAMWEFSQNEWTKWTEKSILRED